MHTLFLILYISYESYTVILSNMLACTYILTHQEARVAFLWSRVSFKILILLLALFWSPLTPEEMKVFGSLAA